MSEALRICPRLKRSGSENYCVGLDLKFSGRELMYDKRSAWVLAGIAPQRFSENRLSDIEVAMMTELPVTKQTLADQISGFTGCGLRGLVASRRDLRSGESVSLTPSPSQVSGMEHGIAAFVKFFPEAKELIARVETDLWTRLGLFGRHKSPVIFDDQYISTGGQMYEMLMGHYRFYGDIRPEALRVVGMSHTLCCHPYDVAAGLLLHEAGCIYESPWGGGVDAPMDITPVSWVAFSNRHLADLVRPVLRELMNDYFIPNSKKGL